VNKTTLAICGREYSRLSLQT